MTGFAFRSALFTLALTAHASTLNATTTERFDLRQLTENAFCIFNGVCRSVEGISSDGLITTAYVFTVHQVLKGDIDNGEITFSLPGGVVGRSRSQIVGMPDFRPGEETVLFLTHPDRNGAVWPVGLSQGKFLVDRGPDGVDPPQVFHSASSGTFTLPQASTTSKSVGEPALVLSSSGLPLSGFLSVIRTFVDEDPVAGRSK